MIDTARHSRGVYYTPRWLADLILDEAGYDGTAGVRLLDPSCGEGVFLAAAIERARKHGTRDRILREIHGFELDPKSAETARATYLEALGDLAAGLQPGDVPVRCVDAILQPPEVEPFDIVAGNPPWVRWDHLTTEYRQATLPLWKRYGLFSLKGFDAVSGAGKKDLCMLFTYVAADRFLRTGGKLAFLVTQEVFKSKGAGDGFRRFRIGPDGPPLRVIAAHDFVALRPFRDATNKSAALLLTKGEPTEYPLPYCVWTRDKSGALAKQILVARPMGSVTGPWRTTTPEESGPSSLEGPNAYKPVLGFNANPYGVFWLEVQRRLSGGLAEVRNLPELGKSVIPAVSAILEAEPVYPAVRGADIQPWRATPRIHVLAVQDPVARYGYPEELLSARWPRVSEYLEQFRETLLERALYRRYHQQSARPYYSQFNMAASAFAPYKVAWRRMTNDIAAAVISTWDGPLGNKIVLPLETTAFIGVETADEAHYLCAHLNSNEVRSFVKSFSAAGRGFGTPSTISRVKTPKYDPANASHRALAAISLDRHTSLQTPGN